MKLSNDPSRQRSQEPWITASPQELAPWFDEEDVPRLREARFRQPPKPPAPWKMALCVANELVLFVMHYTLLAETLQTIGVEINSYLADDVLIGWIFSAIPDLTARELLSFVTAAFFVGVPIGVWLNLLSEKHPLAGSATQLLVRGFLILAFAFIAAGEFVMIHHRVGLASNNAFGTQSGQEPALAVFFGVVFIIVNASIGYASASIVHQRRLAAGGA